jgi:orotidine-5'-phosphate decarboxylase
MNRLIVALDTIDLRQAEEWATAVKPHAGFLKIGLEFFAANGPTGVRSLSGLPVFLDLKLHDIPNTVAGAIRAILPLHPAMVTVHAAGGSPMIQAARQAAEAAGPQRPMILAVTVLTSIDESSLTTIGISGTISQQVVRLAQLAIASGADGLVCSPLEVSTLRQSFGPAVKLVVPGIRPEGSPRADQVRTMTPKSAVEAGADWIVVGRPITAAADPGRAAAEIAARIQ